MLTQKQLENNIKKLCLLIHNEKAFEVVFYPSNTPIKDMTIFPIDGCDKTGEVWITFFPDANGYEIQIKESYNSLDSLQRLCQRFQVRMALR